MVAGNHQLRTPLHHHPTAQTHPPPALPPRAILGGIPLINRTLNKIICFSAHPCYQNRVCDTWDWWAPRYQHHHTALELKHWFQAAGFTDITELPPEKTNPLYRQLWLWNLLPGSGVNVTGIRSVPKPPSP